MPPVTAGIVEVRRGVVVVISASLVVWPLVENMKTFEEDAKMVVVIGEVVDRARDEEVALDVSVDVDVRNDMVLDIGRDVAVGRVDVKVDVYVDMVLRVDVAASVDVDVAKGDIEVEVVVGGDSEADVDTKVVGDVGVIMFAKESPADASALFMLKSDVKVV